MKRFLTALMFCVGLSLGTGCAPTIPFEAEAPSYPRPMVAKKSSVPLYLVLDADGIPSEGETKDAYAVGYTGLDSFVSRDLKSALGLYFDEVNVVSAAEVPSEGMALVALVRIDTLMYETSRISSSQGVAQMSIPRMDWALAIKVVGGEEFLFSFAGTSTSSEGFATRAGVAPAFVALLGNAVTDLLAAYSDKGVHDAILAAESGEPPATEQPAAPVTTPTPDGAAEGDAEVEPPTP